MKDNSKFWCFFWLVLSCFWTAWNSYQFAMTKSTFSLSMLIFWAIFFVIWVGITIGRND